MKLLLHTVDRHLDFNVLFAWQIWNGYSNVAHVNLGLGPEAEGMGHRRQAFPYALCPFPSAPTPTEVI